MRSFARFGLPLSVGALSMSAALLSAEDWTQFRGPNGSGVSRDAMVPITWNKNENIKWSVDLPGPGSSSPIVLENNVYITCYTGYGLSKQDAGDLKALKRHLICFDRASGKEKWRVTVDSPGDEDPYKGFITEHGYASSTPVTDGQAIYVQFGKSGVVAVDLEGQKLWQQNIGNYSDPFKWGSGASPILYKDLVIVNAGIEGHAVMALNKKNGEQVWKVTDEKFTNSWSTPILVDVDGKSELVLGMPGKIVALDPQSGEQLWTAKSPIANTVCASLAESDGVVFAMGGREGKAIGVRCGGSGDVSGSHIVWEKPLQAGIGTPLAVDGRLYWTTRGIAYCAGCESGDEIFKERLPSSAAPDGSGAGQQRSPAGDYASPILLKDKIVMVMRNGKTHVLAAKQEFEQVAENDFEGDSSLFNATPAIADNQMFVRSDKRLYCIQE